MADAPLNGQLNRFANSSGNIIANPEHLQLTNNNNKVINKEKLEEEVASDTD